MGTEGRACTGRGLFVIAAEQLQKKLQKKT